MRCSAGSRSGQNQQNQIGVTIGARHAVPVQDHSGKGYSGCATNAKSGGHLVV